MSDTIRPAAWLPTDRDASIPVRYRALRFPEHWPVSPLPLFQAARGESAQRVPIRRMDQALQALAPGLIVLPRDYRDPDAAPHWLLVPEDGEELSSTAFKTLRNAWLADLCPDAATDPGHRALLREVRGALDADPPPWEAAELELLRCPQTDGGTASLLHHQPTLAADWIARRITALAPFESETGRLEFRPIPGGAERGALLVSQPLPFEKRDPASWYSIYLRITMQTEPFDPLPRFHLHTGVRRWGTFTSTKTGRLRVPYGTKTTVLLRPKVPWLAGAPLAERFAIAKLHRHRDHETGEWTDGWAAGGPAGLLRGISLSEPFPDADAILTDPEPWLTDGMRAAVVHRTSMGRHPVLPGLMPDERSEIMAWAEKALPPELRAMPARRATTLGAPTPRNGRTRKPKLDATRSRAVAAYAMSCLRTGRPEPGPQLLEARLLWQSEHMRDTAVRSLAEQLGLGEPERRPTAEEFEEARPGSAAVVEWATPELTVRLRCLKLTDGLAGDLPIPEGEKRSAEAQRTANAARRDEAAAFLRADEPGPDPSLALVELDRRKAFSSAHHDPKFALRLGFAHAGVLSQFVEVPIKERYHDSVKNIEHRAKHAWNDGLRQLGARLLPIPDVRHGDLPAGLSYGAVWVVRRTRRSRTGWEGIAPLAVRVTPGPADPGLAHIEGWCPDADGGAGGWIPYPSALLNLTQRTDVLAERAAEAGPDSGNRRDEQRRAVQEWLQVVYRSLRHDQIMLMANAQNIRTFWPWMQDGVVECDKIRLGHAPPRPLHPGVRLLRVRTGNDRRGETAQWWALGKPGQANGLAVHLWTSGDRAKRVFWSTTAKPGSFKTPKGIRKVGPNADRQAWIPDLVELAVLGCHPADGDDPETLALAGHHLRQPPEYDQDLRNPLPLHLARLAEEYILPLVDEPEDDVEAATDE